MNKLQRFASWVRNRNQVIVPQKQEEEPRIRFATIRPTEQEMGTRVVCRRNRMLAENKTNRPIEEIERDAIAFEAETARVSGQYAAQGYLNNQADEARALRPSPYDRVRVFLRSHTESQYSTYDVEAIA